MLELFMLNLHDEQANKSVYVAILFMPLRLQQASAAMKVAQCS